MQKQPKLYSIPSLQDTVNTLRATAEAMLAVADSLREGGRPLRADERDMILAAYAPRVREHLDEIRYAMLAPDQRLLEHAMEQAAGLTAYLATL